MACDVNVLRGRTMALAIRNDADTAWELLGGITTKGLDFANNTIDVTSQSTVGSYAEKQFDGYSDATINGDWSANKKTGQVDGNTGYTVIPYTRLLEIQNSPERCAKVQLICSDFIFEGEMTMTSFSINGEQRGVIQGSVSFETRAKGALTVL